MGQNCTIEQRQLRLWDTRRALSKYTVREENVRIKYAVSSMQGMRPHMEDAHTAILDLDGARTTSFFGVYDGHGGANVAKHCANFVHTELLSDAGYPNDLANALVRVFSRMDVQLREYDEWRTRANPQSSLKTPARVKGTPKFEGSTACVVIIREHEITVANVGDSRCVLSRNGQAIDLSTDHRPDHPDESQRINVAGERVIKDAVVFNFCGEAGVPLGRHRINGMLHMSRSIGDFHFKSNVRLNAAQQAVTCIPEVRTEAITHDTEFLLIASDGIWDALSSQAAVRFVHQKLEGGTTDLRTICEALLNRCYSSSKDNSTVILVQFRHFGRLAHPPPRALPAVHPTVAGSSSNPSSSTAGIPLDAAAADTPGSSTAGIPLDAAADTKADIKEDIKAVIKED